MTSKSLQIFVRSVKNFQLNCVREVIFHSYRSGFFYHSRDFLVTRDLPLFRKRLPHSEIEIILLIQRENVKWVLVTLIYLGAAIRKSIKLYRFLIKM